MNGKTPEHVIRHEKAHLQRHDHWWKPLGFLLLSVYWFNPLCWIAYILLCRDIEMACDEKVIRNMDKDDRAAYSQALLDCSLPGKRIAACPLAFGEVGVKERVKGVLNYKKPAFRIILIAMIACIVLAVCLMTDPFSNKSLSGKLGVSMDMAVAEHHHSSETEGHFVTMDYDVLRVSKSAKQTTVYAWVMYEEYSFDGTDVKEEAGAYIPTAITFDTSSENSDKSTYDVIEYWEPRDGNDYAEDIRDKFPLGIRAKAFDVSGADGQHEKCLRAAREYFGESESKWPDTQDEIDMESLRAKYPEYFDLSTFKGLEVYVWQMAPGSYSCGVMPGTDRNKTLEERMHLKGASIAEMRAILSTYDMDEEDIFIIPWQNPVSSYIAEYWISRKEEDPAAVEKRKQEYLDGIRQMLFGMDQVGGHDLTSPMGEIKTKTAYANWTEDSRVFTCLNAEKLLISSVRHLPVYKLNAREDLERFKENFRDILTLDQGYDEVPSFNDMTALYDDSFFADHTVILAYVTAPSGSFRYAIQDISYGGSTFCLDVVQINDPETHTDDMAGWFVIAEVLDSDIADDTEFDAQLVERLPQSTNHIS